MAQTNKKCNRLENIAIPYISSSGQQYTEACEYNTQEEIYACASLSSKQPGNRHKSTLALVQVELIELKLYC